jgi:ferritin
MMDKAVHDAVNAQIKMEFDSAYIYLAMAAHFEDENLSGFAGWMRLQAAEEKGHAMRLFDYLVERGARVVLKGIDEPPAKFGSPKEIFEMALEHERKVTASINKLYGLAVEKNDYPTQVMLQWFIEEQVEEEDSAETAVQQLSMAGDNMAALLMLDRQFGAREAE